MTQPPEPVALQYARGKTTLPARVRAAADVAVTMAVLALIGAAAWWLSDRRPDRMIPMRFPWPGRLIAGGAGVAVCFVLANLAGVLAIALGAYVWRAVASTLRHGLKLVCALSATAGLAALAVVWLL